MVIEIIDAQYLEGYKIRFQFQDFKESIIDFESFLKKSKNPMTTFYLNKEKFKNFKIEYGDILWGDYEMCFPIWDLYEGKIE